jgi:hypothetical protein
MPLEEPITPGTPVAGSPELRSATDVPMGIFGPGAQSGRNRKDDITFDEATQDSDHGRYNRKTGSFD